jgi:hypothetical protein
MHGTSPFRAALFSSRAALAPGDTEGQPSEWYLVDKHIWETVTRANANCQYLCIGCLVDRLGRQLTAADFPDIPINRPS